jgi:hypothetical protein
MVTSQLPRLPLGEPHEYGGLECYDSDRGTGPERARTRGSGRFRGLGARDKWGYGVWLFAGLVFGVPESWAGIASPPWPALSDTIAHLESIWAPTAVIVVALIVVAAVSVTRRLAAQSSRAAGRGLPWPQTAGQQRLTGPEPATGRASALAYFPLALGAVAGGSLIAAAAGGGRWVLGYVIYGLFTIFLVIIPNIMAFWFDRQVPFPSLAQTVADLQRRWRPATTIIVTGLVILMIHLVLAPWPDIFNHRIGR